MTAILRVKTRWSGFNGAPGYTVMHFRDFGTGEGSTTPPDAAQAKAAADRARAFFLPLASMLPSAVQIQVEGEVDVIEDTTGELIDSYAVAQPAIVQGANTGNYSAASGAVVNWRTGGIRNGRRIRGRSFIVPLASAAYSTSGTLTPSAQSTLQAAATALADRASTPDLGVYARPTGPGAADGQWSVVTSGQVPNILAVLRSRRD